MKILASTLSAAGHINATIGLCQALQERGHQIYFVVESDFIGQLYKFDFEKILLRPKDDAKKTATNSATKTENPFKKWLCNSKKQEYFPT